MSTKIHEEIKTTVDSIVEKHESLKREQIRHNKLTTEFKKISFNELIENIKLILASEHNPKLKPFVDSLSKITHFNSGGFRSSIVARFGEDVYWSISYTSETTLTHVGGRTTKTITWRFQHGLLNDPETIGLNYVALHFKEINDQINDHEDRLSNVFETSKRIKC